MKKLLKYDESITPNKIDKNFILKWRSNVLEINSKVSWNNLVRHLKALINFGMEVGLIDLSENPFIKVKVIEDLKPKKTFTDEQLNKIKSFIFEENIDNYYKFINPSWFYQTIIILLMTTGIRRNQLLLLKISDVDLHKKKIIINGDINKNHKYYIIPIVQKLHPLITYLIKQHQIKGSKNNEQLFNINKFKFEKDRNMSQYQLDNFFDYLSKKLNFKISPHRFRHTIATNLMKKDHKNLYITQKLLGHSSIQTTLEYIEYDVNTIRDAIEKL